MWEYKIINDWEDGNPDSEYELNELGKEGWELVCVIPTSIYSGKHPTSVMGEGKRWYFKRPDHL